MREKIDDERKHRKKRGIKNGDLTYSFVEDCWPVIRMFPFFFFFRVGVYTSYPRGSVTPLDQEENEWEKKIQFDPLSHRQQFSLNNNDFVLHSLPPGPPSLSYVEGIVSSCLRLSLLGTQLSWKEIRRLRNSRLNACSLVFCGAHACEGKILWHLSDFLERAGF